MKRTPLQRRTPLRSGKAPARRTSLRSTPSKRARPDEPLASACEFGLPGVCTGYPQYRHHILPRTAGGSDEATNTADICFACHSWVHLHPAISYENGWLKRRGIAA